MGSMAPMLPQGPMKWSPRAIRKVRDVNRLGFEKSSLELLILRADVDQDWTEIDKDIWVKVKY